jgi:ankyrin repeat protein
MAMLLEKASIDINKTNNFEQTPLMIAAFLGHHRCVALLVNHRGIDINYQRDNHDSALIMAAERGHDQCVQIILEHRDCDFNARGGLNRTALMKAARYGHTECLKLLRDKDGIDINAKMEKFEDTALTLAARHGHYDCVQQLLQHKEININATSTSEKFKVWHTRIFHMTALMWAAINGDKASAKLLIQQGANLDITNTDGKTARDLAITHRRPVIAQLIDDKIARDTYASTKRKANIGSAQPQHSSPRLTTQNLAQIRRRQMEEKGSDQLGSKSCVIL